MQEAQPLYIMSLETAENLSGLFNLTTLVRRNASQTARLTIDQFVQSGDLEFQVKTVDFGQSAFDVAG